MEAQALYDQAMVALEARDFASACPTFERASALVPHGIGVRLMLAECLDGWGKPAHAYAVYRRAGADAQAAGQGGRSEKAAERMRAIEPRIARMTVVLAPAVAALGDVAVAVNDAPVAPGDLGAAIPLQPGRVTVRATGSAGSFERALDVGPGASATVTVDALTPTATTPPPPAPRADEPGPRGAPGPPPDVATSSGVSGLSIAGLVVGSVGFVAGGVGIGLAATGASAGNEAVESFRMAEDAGDTQGADQALADHDGAKTQVTVGWALVAVGGATLVAGVVMFAMGSGGDEPDDSALLGVSPWIAGEDGGARGLGVTRRW